MIIKEKLQFFLRPVQKSNIDLNQANQQGVKPKLFQILKDTVSRQLDCSNKSSLSDVYIQKNFSAFKSSI